METDNRELGKKIGNALNNLKQEIFVKLAGVKSCEKEFSPPQYLRSISKAEVDFNPEKAKKTQTVDYNESDIEHPELFQQLKDWRARMAKKQGLAHFQILHQRVLIQIVVNLPGSRTQLKKINGVGKKTLEKYGDNILALVAGYRQKHGIDGVKLPDVKDEAEVYKSATK
jgi:superfamily II DNA helicase RecQ